jgi:hypothetical protein
VAKYFATSQQLAKEKYWVCEKMAVPFLKIRKAPIPFVPPVNSRTILPSIAEKIRNLKVDALQAQRVRTDFLDVNSNEFSLEETRLQSTAVTPISLSLPPTVGSAGQVLTTDGTGILTFETPAVGSISEGQGIAVSNVGPDYTIAADLIAGDNVTLANVGNGIQISSAGGGPGSFPAFSSSLSVYVSKAGNDTTGVGTPNQPYLTITKAYSVISDASTIKRYCIEVGSGRFDETSLVVKPWIWLVGQQRSATRVTTSVGHVTLDASFSTGNHRFGFKDILISGSNGVNFDLQTLGGSGSTVMEAQAFYVNNAFTFIGRTTADFTEVWNCQFLGTITLRAAQGLFRTSYLGPMVLDDTSVTGANGFIFQLQSSSVNGNVTITQTEGAKVFDVSLTSFMITGTLTVTSAVGASSPIELSVDSESYGLAPVISANTVVTFIESAASTVYVPVNANAYQQTIATVKSALDTKGNQSIDPAITANAGGGQGSAYQLVKNFNNITTVATSGDSVKLPLITTQNQGATFTIYNNGVAQLAVFPGSGQAIGTGGANIPVTINAGANASYLAFSIGTWFVL